LNVVQSDELKYPSVVPFACGIDIFGVAPPEEAIGEEPVTLVTPPPPPPVATKGLAGVPRPVMVVPSTDILTMGFNGSELFVFKPLTL
jgi:hypothetical protein